MELRKAIQSGDMAAVKAALKTNPKAAKSPRAVGAAAGRALLPALKLLLQHGADLNAAWRNYRPLHNLLQGSANGVHGEPERARLECLEWLLANGADPELYGAWPPARALVIAAFTGRPEYVNHLRKARARLEGYTAAALGDRKRVEKALQNNTGFALERDGGYLTALQCASGSRIDAARTLNVAQLLLDSGADANALTRTWSGKIDACHLASGAEHAAMFELLLERGADPTRAVTAAIWGKRFEMAECALAHGAKLDEAIAEGKPLLNELIRWGQVSQALWMLEHGASPNRPDARGWTATHQAASRGNTRMIRAVIAAGADLIRRDSEQRTPLDIARAAKHSSLECLLAVDG